MIKKLSEHTILDIFKSKAIKDNRVFQIDKCSFCNYRLGYFWKDNQIYFDAGCYCIGEKLIEARSESELLKFIKANIDHINECFEENGYLS